MLKTLLSKERRKERALTKAVAKAGNSKIKPEDRQPALHYLLEEGNDQAISGLLNRLTFVYDTNLVSDEEEKHYVYDGLAAMGDRILPVLRKHLRSASSLSWGLKLLKQVCDPDQSWAVLQEVLEDFDPEYERDPSRKQQLLTFLGEFDDPRVASAILPFLDDHDETVRFIVIEALFRLGTEQEVREPLLVRLTSDEAESLRIRNRIAEGFIEKSWVVRGHRGAVEKALSDDYAVDGKGRIKVKKGRS